MDRQAEPFGYFDESSCDLGEFEALVSQTLDPGSLLHTDVVVKNIPVYTVAELQTVLAGQRSRKSLMAEWARVLRELSGVLVLKGAFSDTGPVDRASEIFDQIIADEKKLSGGGADHFAAAGANDRIWNSLQKLCLKAPSVFADYFANPAIDTICEAWLGPNYQMTSQVNLVRPGGAAQQAHRDYHLGFQSAEDCARYPAHVHDLSPVMTLQGAVAHTDMPVESGPTKLLPFSQLYRAGYAAYRVDAFKDFFEKACVQLPLKKGDAVFSTRRSSMLLVLTPALTFNAWPTCCKSHRPSAGPWKRLTEVPCVGSYTRHCWTASKRGTFQQSVLRPWYPPARKAIPSRPILIVIPPQAGLHRRRRNIWC